MSYLVRKINRAKWAQTNPDTGDIAADAITICLKTSNNELSFWRVNNKVDAEINDVIVAMTAGGDRVDTIDIAIIDEEEISKHCKIVDSTGLTPIEDMKDKHCDLVELTYNKLGEISKLIYNEIKGDTYRRITTKPLKALLLIALSANKFQPEELQPTMRADLKIE